jgi:hypothetical protein
MPNQTEIAPAVFMNVRTKKTKPRTGSIAAINPATTGPELEVLVNWDGGGSSWIPWAGLIPTEQPELLTAGAPEVQHVLNVIIPALRANPRVSEVQLVSELDDPHAILGMLVDSKPVSLMVNPTP